MEIQARAHRRTPRADLDGRNREFPAPMNDVCCDHSARRTPTSAGFLFETAAAGLSGRPPPVSVHPAQNAWAAASSTRGLCADGSRPFEIIDAGCERFGFAEP